MASNWLEQLGHGIQLVRAIGSWRPIGLERLACNAGIAGRSLLWNGCCVAIASKSFAPNCSWIDVFFVYQMMTLNKYGNKTNKLSFVRCVAASRQRSPFPKMLGISSYPQWMRQQKKWRLTMQTSWSSTECHPVHSVINFWCKFQRLLMTDLNNLFLFWSCCGL